MDEAKDIDFIQNLEEASAKSRATPIKKGWGNFPAWKLNEIKGRMHDAFDNLDLSHSSVENSSADSASKFQEAAEPQVKIKILNVENTDPTHSISDPEQAQSEEPNQFNKAA